MDLSGLNDIALDPSNMLARCGPGAIVADLQKKLSMRAFFTRLILPPRNFVRLAATLPVTQGVAVRNMELPEITFALSGYLATGEFVTWGRATRKFATGYNLRDLWIGSEGRGGVVKEAVLRLVPHPSNPNFHCRMPQEEMALSAPVALLKMGMRPSIIEFLDQWTVDCLQKYTGKEIFSRSNPYCLSN